MDRQELMSMVERITQENLSKIDEEVRKKFRVEIVNKDDYFEYYQSQLKQTTKPFFRGKPDTFIQAAYLCEALIECKRLRFDLTDEISAQLLLINYTIAFEVACTLIQKPEVFREENDSWILISQLELKSITVPEGIVPNSPLKEKIIQNLASDEYYGREFSVTQFSNLLHMIYLYNIKF